MAPSAPLFAPFRALGYVCDDVPLAVQRLGKETFITVSVGNTWQVYAYYLTTVGIKQCAANGQTTVKASCAAVAFSLTTFAPMALPRCTTVPK